MHYPHKISKVKRARKLGFRARMRTKDGRAMISRKRRVGRARAGCLIGSQSRNSHSQSPFNPGPLPMRT